MSFSNDSFQIKKNLSSFKIVPADGIQDSGKQNPEMNSQEELFSEIGKPTNCNFIIIM